MNDYLVTFDIRSLTAKYLVETLAWNTTHQTMPTTAQQSYINAETFMRLKGFSLLIEKGVKLQAFIQSTIKPTI